MRLSRGQVCLAAIGTLMAVVVTPAQPAMASTDRHADIQHELDAMVAAGVPGVVASIAYGNARWRAEAGVSDVDTGRRLPTDGRFRIGSVTKSMVATVVLQLIHEGRLSLTDTVHDLLPDLVPTGRHIDVERLLNHTSGLADYVTAGEFADPARYLSRRYTPERLVEIANGLESDTPGARWAYSNTNYILLGMIIEKVTGHPLHHQLRWRVFLPAGMFDTSLPTGSPYLAAPHASGYYRMDPGPRVEATELDPSFAWAAYGVVSTATDLQRFYRSLFSGRLLPQTLVTRMLAPAVPTNNPVWPRYGLGLEEMRTTCGITLWGHTGAIPGYQTTAFTTPDGAHGMVVSTNLFSPRDGTQVLHAVHAVNIEFCGERWHL